MGFDVLFHSLCFCMNKYTTSTTIKNAVAHKTNQIKLDQR